MIAYLLTTGGILAGAFLIGAVLGEDGTFAYPLLTEQNGAIAFMTITEYMAQALLVLSVTIGLVIALFLLDSLFFKLTLATLFVLLATLAAGYALFFRLSELPGNT